MDIDDTADRVMTAAIEHLRDVGFPRLADNLEATCAAMKAEVARLNTMREEAQHVAVVIADERDALKAEVAAYREVVKAADDLRHISPCADENEVAEVEAQYDAARARVKP